MRIRVAIAVLLFGFNGAMAQSPVIQMFPVDGADLALSWWDSGSGADIDGSFWGPPASPFASFSHIAKRGYGRPAEMLLAIDFSAGGDAFADPMDYTFIWNDSGSGADIDGAAWRPNPQPGYTCLGMVVTRGGAPAADAVACLRSDLAVLGTVGDLIWWDKGSGANADFSAWAINCPDGAISVDGFIGVNSYFKPAGPVYCLSEDAVVLPDGPAEPAVELLYTDQFTSAWNDSGSGADRDGSFWVPTLPAGQDINTLSHFAQRGYGSPIGMLATRELVAQSGALVEPKSYELIWTDAGSGADQNGAVWRPAPPLGYRCIGMLVTNGAVPAADAVACVHRDLTVPGTVGDLVWNDAGSGADSDFSAWKIDCPDGAIATDAFIGTQGHSKPTGSVHCLKGSAVSATATPSRMELEQLIGLFGPVIKFHPGELFLPDDPAAIIDDPSTEIIWETVQNESSYAGFVEVFLGSYGNPTSTTILDDVQLALSHAQAGDADFRYFLDFSSNGALKSGNLDRTKAYVRVQPSDGVFVELQFWIFYPWNGPGKADVTCGIIDVGTYVPTGRNGEHYSDWENIRVRATKSKIGDIGNYNLVDVVISRHSFEERVGAADPRLQFSNGHPVVYSAKDSHAHYLAAGTHVYTTKTTDLGLCDLDVDLFDQTGDGQVLNAWDPAKYAIESSAWPSVATTSSDWLFFGGMWGGYDRAEFCTDPSGVYEHCEQEIQNGKPGLIRRNEWDLSCPENANLGSLRASVGTLSPAFSPDVTAYSLTDIDGIAELTLTPQAAEHEAEVAVSVNGGAFAVLGSGPLLGKASDALPLSDGDNSIDIRVTVQGCTTTVETYTISADTAAGQQFNDVPTDYWAYSFIQALFDSGITAGCGNGGYCPTAPVTRAQMAVFLERGINGSSFSPPAATGNLFNDVGAGAFAASFIEQLANDGITAGCGNNNYCPDAEVTRDQMAVFLLRAKYGSSYSPPAATGVFGDVPLNYWAVAWIEQLAAEGITAGCGSGNYCPESPVTRDQMAVFLVRTFDL